jgi:Tol biopolymer transport system component
MWRLSLAAVPVAVLALVFVGGVASQTDTPTSTPESSPSSSPSPSASPSPSPSAVASQTPQPLPPPPPATPFDPNAGQPQSPSIDPGYPGTLRPGDWVQITNTDSCLNLRYEPRMPAPLPDGTVHDNVLNCLPDGFIGRLDGYGWGRGTTLPVNADGRWWWHIVGQGWAADEFLAFHHQGGLPWPEQPDLANAGLIAYVGRDNGIWLMSADGRDAHNIVGGDANQWVQTLQWSPLGDRLAFTVGRPDGTFVTRVIDLNGNIAMEIVGLGEPRWSPGGGRLSGIRGTSGGLGGYQGTPVVFDLGTGAEWALGPTSYYTVPPAWRPDGESLAFVCVSGYLAQPEGTMIIEEGRDCHGDGLRIVSVDGSRARILVPFETPNGGWYLSNPSWSPSGGTIAVYSMQADGAGCRGYIFVDAASGGTGACVPLPPTAPIGGRCGGGSEMGASTWTPDGRFIFSAQGAGQSGVFVHDPASGGRTVIPNMNAEPVSLSSQNVTFAGAGHIWVAGLDGSNLTLLAEGHSPVWQPLP